MKFKFEQEKLEKKTLDEEQKGPKLILTNDRGDVFYHNPSLIDQYKNEIEKTFKGKLPTTNFQGRLSSFAAFDNKYKAVDTGDYLVYSIKDNPKTIIETAGIWACLGIVAFDSNNFGIYHHLSVKNDLTKLKDFLSNFESKSLNISITTKFHTEFLINALKEIKANGYKNLSLSVDDAALIFKKEGKITTSNIMEDCEILTEEIHLNKDTINEEEYLNKEYGMDAINVSIHSLEESQLKIQSNFELKEQNNTLKNIKKKLN